MENGGEEEQKARRVPRENGVSEVCLDPLESRHNLKQIVTEEIS